MSDIKYNKAIDDVIERINHLGAPSYNKDEPCLPITLLLGEIEALKTSRENAERARKLSNKQARQNMKRIVSGEFD